jgi:hypothetical protein
MARNDNQAIILCAFVLGLAPAIGALAADRTNVVNESASVKIWAPDPAHARTMPGYPSTFADKSEDACVSIGYLLNRDGSTSDYTMLKSWGAKTPDNSRNRNHLDALAQAAVATVQSWHFVPAPGNRAKIQPIYTAATFSFTSNASADRESLNSHCRIADLPSFVAKAQAMAYRRGNLQKGRLERDRVENAPVISGH